MNLLLVWLLKEEMRHPTYRQILMARTDHTILGFQDEEEPFPIPAEEVDHPICQEGDEGLFQARACLCLRVEDCSTIICLQ